MINFIISENFYSLFAGIGLMAAFLMNCVCITKFNYLLPKDAGRDFAHDGKLSAGKPRGAGIIFILVFAAAALLFSELSVEIVIYIVLVIAEMLTGYLDDASENPWNEYKKGLLDLLVAVVLSLTFMHYNSSTIEFAIPGISVTIPPVVFCLLSIVLIWVSINVTNCSDGVDGLSATLTIITLITLYIVKGMKGTTDNFSYLILLFVICLLGYLWYNAAPSHLMMGDAGSRAMGIFIAIAALKTESPFLYIFAAFVLIADGGIGIVKVALLRFLKIKILTNVRTPLHDHVRKVWDWSNTQTVFRFGIIQIVISVATIYMLML